MVSFIEYIVGRQTGIYRPPYPASPTGHRDVQFREPKKIARPFDTFQEEFWKEKAREADTERFPTWLVNYSFTYAYCIVYVFHLISSEGT